MLNILVKTIIKKYMRMNSVMMKSPNNKKHTLKVIPNDIRIEHLTHINKKKAGIQSTTHNEDHNNTNTNLPQNNSSHTSEKLKIPETKIVPLNAVHVVKPLDSKLSRKQKSEQQLTRKLSYTNLITTIHQNSSNWLMNREMQLFSIAVQVKQCAGNLGPTSS